MFIRQGNNAILCGNCCRDAECKKFNKNGKTYTLTEVSVAVGKDDKGQGIFKTLYSWGSALNAMKKGNKVFAVGIAEINEYDGKDGLKHSIEKVNVEFAQLITATKKSVTESDTEINKFEEVVENDLPF